MTSHKTAYYVETYKICCRRCYVELNKGSVLSPILFTIHTNDQPLHDGTRNIIYADVICVTAQYPSFTKVEHTIAGALDELTTYYKSNSLRANTDKTQVKSFHPKK